MEWLNRDAYCEIRSFLKLCKAFPMLKELSRYKIISDTNMTAEVLYCECIRGILWLKSRTSPPCVYYGLQFIHQMVSCRSGCLLCLLLLKERMKCTFDIAYKVRWSNVKYTGPFRHFGHVASFFLSAANLHFELWVITSSNYEYNA